MTIIYGEIIDVRDIPGWKLQTSGNDEYLYNAKLILREGLNNRVRKYIEGFQWWSGDKWQKLNKCIINTFIWESLPPSMDNPIHYKGIRKAFYVIVPIYKYDERHFNPDNPNGFIHVNTFKAPTQPAALFPVSSEAAQFTYPSPNEPKQDVFYIPQNKLPHS